jgi:hypothetical protein
LHLLSRHPNLQSQFALGHSPFLAEDADIAADKVIDGVAVFSSHCDELLLQPHSRSAARNRSRVLRDNLDEKGGGDRILKRRPVAGL